MNPSPRFTGAALAALVVFCPGSAPGPALAWSEFGSVDEPEVAEGPEIREPFFEFLLGMAQCDSLGLWTGDQLRAQAAASGRGSRFPLETVVSLERARPDASGAHRYRGAVLRAVWTLVLDGDQDHPMPYSILGYHPGSLRVAGVLVLGELAPTDLEITYREEDREVSRLITQVRVFPLETGSVVLDADGFLDALLGSGLDDSWTLGFVTGREDGKLVGLGVSLGRDGRRIFGEFDFTQDKVLVNGRPAMSALSSASRRWLNNEAGNLPEPWVEP
jgi:hypothetical protein